jgi:predicted GIY-YIG superfamily endonuclease
MESVNAQQSVTQAVEHTEGTVYLLCFQDAAGHKARHKHAGHYLGFANNLRVRLKMHQCGRGARLMAVVIEQGLMFKLARTWDGSRSLERRLKNQKNAPRLCPLCRAAIYEA